MLLLSTYGPMLRLSTCWGKLNAMSQPPSTPAPKTDRYHHGDLRAALLDAAAALLAEHGVAGLSLRDCSRHAGVSHAAPYRHFASKEALLAALASQGFGWLYAAGMAAMAPHSDPVTRLDAYGHAYVRFALTHPHHFRLMFTSEIAPAAPPPSDQGGESAYVLLRDAAAAVSGSRDDPDLVAVSYWSRPHGLAMLLLDRRIPPERIGSDEALTQMIQAALGDDRPAPGRPTIR